MFSFDKLPPIGAAAGHNVAELKAGMADNVSSAIMNL